MNVSPDAHMTRKGADVHSNLEITFSDAALGATKDVETLDGALDVKIPAGVQTGEEVRLKGRGAERLQASGRGDHYVHIIVRTPRNVSKKARGLLEELKDEGL
jgi:molecular chaperone DnaJ